MEEYIVRVYNDRTEWLQNGKRHRTVGPAIEWTNGDKYWLQNGQYHRTDGPAVEWADGSKFWLQNGQYHRTDGPAIEWADGYAGYAKGFKEYWLEGKQYTEKKFLKKTQLKIEELTVAEISKRLGYEVKIVKG
jgi:hypothetical protein